MLIASAFADIDPVTGRVMLRAMPVLVAALCVLALAYRYYSAFLAAKVACLDPRRPTPARLKADGSDFVPTNRWVLFGHHFAAISGAGPLIGPVLAMQYGYAPGLLWLLAGVCLAGAAQDMLVLAASVRHGGKSLGDIARVELGRPMALLVTLATLVIVVIALAGLSFVVIKALGGEDARLPAGMTIRAPDPAAVVERAVEGRQFYDFPGGCRLRYAPSLPEVERPEAFTVRTTAPAVIAADTWTLPAKSVQVIPGSAWGTFTIACTIPIALLVGVWMHRLRPGRVVEASVVGGLLVLGAVIVGGSVAGTPLGEWFRLDRRTAIWALGIYGVVAAVLPVWMLLTPRDYISSFLKIGTLALLVVGVIVANPVLRHEPLNPTFADGGPTLPGKLFPFVFICIMCGAISGFHALVASGTTPKMIASERDIRPIGYGAMLTEGLVGLVALLVAASMPVRLYNDINVDVEKAPVYQQKLDEMYQRLEGEPAARDRLYATGIGDTHKLDLATVERDVGGESLRGRTGGAVTLAVGMALILTEAFRWADDQAMGWMKYWYHFAIMFEALFILTVIDAGTRIGRYLFQEAAGQVYPRLGRSDWLPGSLFAAMAVTAGWMLLVSSGQIATIWPMFGIVNQLLSVMALAIVATWLINNGRGWYALTALLPMLFVSATTLMAARILAEAQYRNIAAGVDVTTNAVNLGLTLFVTASAFTLVAVALSQGLGRWVTKGKMH